MKGFALYRRKNGKWCLVEIPDEWRRGDSIPKQAKSDMSFDTKEQAIVAFVGRMGQVPSVN
jgi:hypothetical protein